VKHFELILGLDAAWAEALLKPCLGQPDRQLWRGYRVSEAAGHLKLVAQRRTAGSGG